MKLGQIYKITDGKFKNRLLKVTDVSGGIYYLNFVKEGFAHDDSDMDKILKTHKVIDGLPIVEVNDLNIDIFLNTTELL